MANRDRASPRRWLAGAVLLISLILVGWLLYRNRADLVVLADLHPGLLALVFVLQGLYLVVQSARYQVVLEKCAEKRVGFGPWLRLYLIGRFLNLFVPQAGNVYRAIELKRTWQLSVTRYVATLFSAAWMTTVFNFVLAAGAVVAVEPGMRIGGVSALGVLVVLIGSLAGGPPVANRLLSALPVRWERAEWLRGRLSELLSVTVENLSDRRYLLRVLFWSLASFLQASLIFWVCFRGLSVEASFLEVVVFYVILQLTAYISLTPGNLGIQELAFGLLGAGTGLGAVEGVLVSALLRVTGYIDLAVLAIPMGGMQALRRYGRGEPQEEGVT